MGIIIAEVAAPGGGTIGVAPLPGRNGTLPVDVDLIRAWRPAVVVSMTEPEEMRRAGAADLPERLREAGIAWRAFPVRDFGVPAPEEPGWPPLAAALHAFLDGDGRVLLHCHGGKGRSGMVAARLLVERGVAPAEALALVRAARPGAVETAEQEAWSAKTRPNLPPPSPLAGEGVVRSMTDEG
jgi:hypothetical protein